MKKNNKNKGAVVRNISSRIKDIFRDYERQKLSESIKQGLRMKRIREFEFQFGLAKHDELPQEFVDRVKKYKTILKDVEKSTVEEALDNFKRDMYPHTELIVWECIARHYQKITKANPDLTPKEKKDLFTEALIHTLG